MASEILSACADGQSDSIVADIEQMVRLYIEKVSAKLCSFLDFSNTQVNVLAVCIHLWLLEWTTEDFGINFVFMSVFCSQTPSFLLYHQPIRILLHQMQLR